MKEMIKLVRWTNLVIVAATMIMIRYFVIQPLIEKTDLGMTLSYFQQNGLIFQLPLSEFIILISAIIFLTGAAYIINDYFDIKTDLINKGKVIVGREISRRKAMMWHNTLNIAGVAAGLFVSLKEGSLLMGMLFIIVSGLLYFYSAKYKRRFLTGNIIVAVLTAMVPMLVIIFESLAIRRFYTINQVPMPDIGLLFFAVGGFAVFAFFTTLIREIIKDIEDYEGDSEYRRKTLPVVIGIESARKTVMGLLALTIVLLYVSLLLFINSIYSIIYISVAVVIPLIYVIYLMIKSKNRAQFQTAGRCMKIVTITGILFSILLKYVL